MSGLRTSLKDPDLMENVYVYDNAGRLVTEQLEAGKTVYFGYDASGMLTRRHMPQNVIIAYYDYDVAGRNTVNKQKGAFLDTRIYYRNKNGAIEVEDAGSSNFLYYGYDALDRLTSEKIQASGTITSNAYYAWDAASNRTIKTDEMGAGVRTYYTYDSRNLLSKEQILGGTSTYYDFDAAQRMTRQRAGAVVTYFGFTQRDQIARLHNVGLADPIQYFSYSGAGERVRVREGSTETYWSHDGGKLLRERQSTGTLVARYRHNMSPVPAGSNVMTYFRRSDTSEWVNVSPKYNHQGSVQVLSETDGSESALATYVYEDQFGVTDLASATNASAQRLQFAIGGGFTAVTSSLGLQLNAKGFWLPRQATDGLHSLMTVCRSRPQIMACPAPGEWIEPQPYASDTVGGCYRLCREKLKGPFGNWSPRPEWIDQILCLCVCHRRYFEDWLSGGDDDPSEQLQVFLRRSFNHIGRMFRGTFGPPGSPITGFPTVGPRLGPHAPPQAGELQTWFRNSRTDGKPDDPDLLGYTARDEENMNDQHLVIRVLRRRAQMPVTGDFAEDLARCGCLFETMLHELMHAEYVARTPEDTEETEDQQHIWLETQVTKLMREWSLRQCPGKDKR